MIGAYLLGNKNGSSLPCLLALLTLSTEIITFALERGGTK